MFKAIGSLFVYKSPKPREGYKHFLRYLSSRKLMSLAETTGHYSKTELIRRIVSQWYFLDSSSLTTDFSNWFKRLNISMTSFSLRLLILPKVIKTMLAIAPIIAAVISGTDDLDNLFYLS